MNITKSKISSKATFPFLSGGGEMGKLIREKDWSKTALGPPAQWPQSLRTMVSVMLDNPFGMYIAWGDDFTQLYNDGYRPILGSLKHPNALGIGTMKTFEEIVDIIGPMFEDVMKGKAVGFPDFMVPLNRDGFIENCYFDFSYSPIRTEDGTIGGVLVTVIETTGKKLAEENLKESKEQLEFAIEAAELASWDFDFANNKFSANHRYNDWLGFAPTPEIGIDLFLHLIATEDKERVIKACTDAVTFPGTIYDIEYKIRPGNKPERMLRAQGKAWFNEDHICYRFNGTLQDITEQSKAINALRKSEDNLRNTILQSPAAMCILRGAEHVVEIANDRIIELWGKTKDEVLNKPIFEGLPEAKGQGLDELLKSVYTTGKTYKEFARPVILPRDGNLVTLYIDFVYEAFREPDNVISGVIAVAMDVTEQVLGHLEIIQSEQRIRAFVDSAPLPIAVYTGIEMKIILANQSILTIWGKGNDVIGKSYKTILPELENQEIFAQLDGVYQSGIPFHAKNQRVEIMTNGELKPYYFNYNFTPLFDTEGKVYGVMNTAADVTELNIAHIKLEESEKRFRNIVEQAPLGIAIFRDPDFIVEMANESSLELMDKKEGDLTGKPLFEVLPELKESVGSILNDVYHNGIPFYGTEFEMILNRYGKKDVAYFNFVYHPLKDTDGNISGIIVVSSEVTESVKAKHALAESEKQFRNLVMQSPISMCIVSGEENIIELANNEMLNNVWRKTPGEVLGKKVLDVFPALEGQKYVRLLQQVRTEGKPYRESESLILYPTDNGVLKFYVDFEFAPLYEIDNSISNVIITVNNVTEKVEARLKVEDAEERLRLAVEAAELGTFEVDIKKDRLIYSPRFAEILGHESSEQLNHQVVSNQVLKDDQELVKAAFESALINGNYFYEARILTPAGAIKWIRTQGKLFYDEQNKPTRLVGSVTDITAAVKYQSELEESEKKFRLLAESLPEFIWTTDKNGIFNYFNEALYRYSGTTPKDGNNDYWLDIIHPEEQEENKRLWAESIETGKGFASEHRFRRSDGEYRWQLSRAIPQRDMLGNIQMWVGSSTDIHELKKQEAERDFFISTASHELKTPITSVKAYIQLLMSMHTDHKDPFLESALASVDRQIVKLTNLISGMLDISKIKSGSFFLYKEDFNINSLIEEVIEEIKQVSSNYQFSFLKEAEINFYGDRERIGQVISNLLTNAVKYSPDATDIRVTSAIADNEIIVSVQDSGIGINKTDQGKIFNRFYRVEGKNERTFPGFGIGLFICQDIVQRHEGKIGVTSEPGKGSIFYFSLPLLNRQ
jgi:PAS domain S-box-containing protein